MAHFLSVVRPCQLGMFHPSSGAVSVPMARKKGHLLFPFGRMSKARALKFLFFWGTTAIPKKQRQSFRASIPTGLEASARKALLFKEQVPAAHRLPLFYPLGSHCGRLRPDSPGDLKPAHKNLLSMIINGQTPATTSIIILIKTFFKTKNWPHDQFSNFLINS